MGRVEMTTAEEIAVPCGDAQRERPDLTAARPKRHSTLVETRFSTSNYETYVVVSKSKIHLCGDRIPYKLIMQRVKFVLPQRRLGVHVRNRRNSHRSHSRQEQNCRCLLLAQSGHSTTEFRCPLSGGVTKTRTSEMQVMPIPSWLLA